MKNIQTINPVALAEKLDAVKNFLLPEVLEDIQKEPRLIEALWFLQWVSIPDNYAGGLARFAEDLIGLYAEKIGAIGIHIERKMSVDEIEEVLKQFPHAGAFIASTKTEIWDTSLDLLSVTGHRMTNGGDPWGERLRADFARDRRKALSAITGRELREKCIEAASEDLSGFLREVCSDQEMSLLKPAKKDSCFGSKLRLWYFPCLWECIFDYMDARAVAVGKSFAETSITREIFHWLELAKDTGKGVLFLGSSRFGKSRAIRAYAEMHPGKVRLVECPSTGSESDLLREICRALGIRFNSATTPLHEQRAAIDSVIRSARFLLCLDEAQFLFPNGGSRRVAPPRLNYIRRAIMDAGIPTAFICTHQSWKHVEQGFLKFSSYTTEQFEGRLLRSPIHLASELTEDEMLDVARIHLPELSTDHLRIIVTPIRTCKGDHLSYIENIALIARRNAAQRGLSVPKLADIEKATGDVLACFKPDAKPTVSEPVERRPAVSQSNAPAPGLSRRRSGGILPHRRETSPTAFLTDDADLSELVAAD